MEDGDLQDLDIILAQRDRNRMDHSNIWRIAEGVKCSIKCNGSSTPVKLLLGASHLPRRNLPSIYVTLVLANLPNRISAPIRLRMWMTHIKCTSDLCYQNLQNKFTTKSDFLFSIQHLIQRLSR